MIVYIKTFNRPFYLDRCLASLKAFGSGVSRVVVLDDGTLPAYLERITARYPHVEIRQSGGQHGKWELVRAKRFEDITSRFTTPQNFWSREIAADAASTICVLEDDTWLTRRVDFAALKVGMRENSLSICRLFWGDAPDGPAQRTVAVRPLWPHESIVVQTARPKHLNDVWGFFLVCMCVYERTFYETAHAGVNDFRRESLMLENVWGELTQSPVPLFFGRLSKRACCQGWAIPGRSDAKYYAMGVEQHVFVDLLNELWLRRGLDPLRDFPADFDIDWLCGLFAEHMPANSVEAYLAWRANDSGARAFPGLVPPARLENL